MKLRFLLCGLLAGIVSPVFVWAAVVGAGQAPSVVAATSAPIGPRVDALFTKWDKPYSPGLILGVALDGQTIYSRGYGMANLEHSIRMSPQIVSESGSVAKQFTASAVALLALRGKLSLDDPIQKYLPELPDVMKPITIRMLLNHTSGLRDIHGLFDLLGRPSYTSPHPNAEVLEVLSHQRDLNFTPGSEYLYTNTGFILAAIIVERVSGRSFSAFCSENIFRPRNLQNTSWRADFTQVVPRRASGYEPGPNGTFLIDSPYSNIIGNGGLLTTVGDWLTWNASLDSATGEWAQVVKLLQTPSKLNDGTALTYGLGIIATQYRGIEEISHGGSTAGYRTFLARYPGKKLSVALLGNSADVNASELVHQVVDIVLNLPKEPEPVPIAIPEASVAAYGGLYRDVAHDHLVELSARGGRLLFRRAALVPTAPHTFVTGSGATRFTFSDLKVGRMQRLAITNDKTVTEYVAVETAKPDATTLADYAGDYFCPELDVVVPISVAAGKLMIRVRPEPAMETKPNFTDGFENELGQFTFTRGADGKITGFAFTNNGGRCRRIAFVKK